MRIVTCTENRSLLLCGIVVASLAACGHSERRAAGDVTTTPAAVPAESANPAAARATTIAEIAVAQKPGIGPYLTDGSGRSVYLFLKDTGDSSSCYDACAAAWPPIVSTAQPVATDAAVRTEMLGTSKRHDGTMQMTYKKAPLYYYGDDKRSGDITGQNKEEFGGKWYLVSPAGGKQEGKETASKRTP
jgi:predicted lipoprotein with Yx(FWY)xxD motif